ncbi:MAG: hypothetical protein JWL95_2709 [Gemmatimonadetes bacterium]|nr:hypothetical protein [Gemmatimonadota bacterium]
MSGRSMALGGVVALMLAAWSDTATAEPLSCTNDFADPHAAMLSPSSYQDPIEGVVTADDPKQMGTFEDHTNPPYTPPEDAYESPTCEKPRPMSNVVDASTPFPYDAYVFKNWSATTQCVSARLIITPYPGGGNGWLLTAAYLGSFDPANIQANYLADANSGIVDHYTFQVPAMAELVVVVTGRPATGEPLRNPERPAMYRPYQLYVGGCGASGSTGGSTTDGGTTDGGTTDGGTTGGGMADGGTSGGAMTNDGTSSGGASSDAGAGEPSSGSGASSDDVTNGGGAGAGGTGGGGAAPPVVGTTMPTVDGTGGGAGGGGGCTQSSGSANGSVLALTAVGLAALASRRRRRSR